MLEKCINTASRQAAQQRANQIQVLQLAFGTRLEAWIAAAATHVAIK